MRDACGGARRENSKATAGISKGGGNGSQKQCGGDRVSVQIGNGEFKNDFG